MNKTYFITFLFYEKNFLSKQVIQFSTFSYSQVLQLIPH
jgi:hypothetical protein